MSTDYWKKNNTELKVIIATSPSINVIELCKRILSSRGVDTSRW